MNSSNPVTRTLGYLLLIGWPIIGIWDLVTGQWRLSLFGVLELAWAALGIAFWCSVAVGYVSRRRTGDAE